MSNFDLEISGKLKSTTKGNVDWYYGGGDVAWTDLATALAGIPTAVRSGKTIGIIENNKVVEYIWATNDYTDEALEKKVSISSSSNDFYETEEDGFHFVDEEGNSAAGINNDGSFYVAKFDTATENKIKALGGNVTVEETTTTTITDKIAGKKIAILGDSISTSNGSAGLTYPQQYWGLLESLQNCDVYVNASGGTTIKVGGQGTAMSDDSRINLLSTDFTPDIIFIFGGVNDFLQDIPLGSLGDTGNSTSFYGALDYLYSKLLTDYTARIFHILPLHNKFSQSGYTVPEYNGINYLTEYIQSIREVAGRYGVGIINTFDDSGINSYNIDVLSDDGIHVKAEGHQLIYDTIISETNNKL